MRNACRVEAEQRRKPNLTPAHDQNMRNEPNFHPGGRVENQKCETNPIYPYAHGMPCPIYAKRTQFATPPPRLCKTNPIYPVIYNLQYTLYNPKAQSRVPHAPPNTKNAKRTQSAARRCFFDFRLSTFASLAGKSPRRSCQSWTNMHNTGENAVQYNLVSRRIK